MNRFEPRKPRPKFETKTDQMRDVDCADLINKLTGWFVEKNKPLSRVDFTCRKTQWDNTITAFFERKGRNYCYDERSYPDELISAEKVCYGFELAKFCRVPYYLIFDYYDRYMVIEFNEKITYRTEWGGRKDRNDLSDMEPCIFIPKYLTQPLTVEVFNANQVPF